MQVTQNLQKWGNSAGVRLPKKVVDAAHLDINQPLAVTIKGGSIVLTPVKKPSKKPNLDELLEGMSPLLTDDEREWLELKPAGREVIDDEYSVSARQR